MQWDNTADRTSTQYDVAALLANSHETKFFQRAYRLAPEMWGKLGGMKRHLKRGQKRFAERPGGKLFQIEFSRLLQVG